MISRILFIALFFAASLSYAKNGASDGASVGHLNSANISNVMSPVPSPYLAPNEHQPKNLLPILERAQKGVYVSVGTERGFMAAGLSDKVTDLLLVDRDPSIVYYNRINIELLKAANNKEQFLYLRQNATESEWQNALKGLATREEITKQWEWWSDSIRTETRMALIYIDPARSRNPEPPFDRANYFFLDENFKRVKRLADLNRIQVLETDVNSPEVFSQLAHFKKLRQPISVIDISNLYDAGHSGANYTVEFLENLKNLAAKKTILIYTAQHSDWHTGWSYVGYRLGTIWRDGSLQFVNKNLKYRPDYLMRNNHVTFFEGQACSRIL